LLSNLANGRHTGVSVAFEAWKLHEQWDHVAKRRWSDKANGVGVATTGEKEREEEGRRKGREPQGDDAVGGRKSDEGWKERLALPWNFCRSPARDILSTEFNRIRARREQICNSPAHVVVVDLSAQWPTSPVFIYDVGGTYKRLRRDTGMRSLVTTETANRGRWVEKKVLRLALSLPHSTVLSWVRGPTSRERFYGS